MIADIALTPIGVVVGGRTEVLDDHWGEVVAAIRLDEQCFTTEALAGLEEFSHLVVVYHFHQAAPEKIEVAARHPRNNPEWPKVGIFAQRGKNRPNRLGVSTCRILGIQGTKISVQGLDAVDGSPVLDVKPYFAEFEPRGAVVQPAWSREIMAEYW